MNVLLTKPFITRIVCWDGNGSKIACEIFQLAARFPGVFWRLIRNGVVNSVIIRWAAYRLNLSNALRPEEVVNLVHGYWTELPLITQVLCLLKVAWGSLWLNNLLSISLARLNRSCYLDRNYPGAYIVVVTYNLYRWSAAFKRAISIALSVVKKWIR